MSYEKTKPSILVTPIDNAPKIKDLWEIDLSPGIFIIPFREFIGLDES